ncbi:MAG: TldD/PmbA family protein [Candidatus Diapherotrites archaeon]|nr:TldD/PmbA family protein [Candidatus Diapherotrites archaeon]
MDELIKYALKKADEAEVYECSGNALLARNSLSKIETLKREEEWGAGVRVVVGGRAGYSYYNNPAQARNAIDAAVKSARLSHNEGYSLPRKAGYERRDVFDKRVCGIDEEGIVEMLLDTMTGVRRFASPSQGEVGVEVVTVRITNSNGVHHEEQQTRMTAYAAAKRKDVIAQHWEASRKLVENVADIGTRAGETAMNGVGAGKLSHTGKIVIDPEVLGVLIEETVIPAINGENARRGKSPWAQDIGKRVATEKLSILDDPTIPWSVGTTAADDEGVPTQKKVLVENGVLKQFLHNSKSANLAGASNTGNGFRQGFTEAPSISSTNTVISATEREDVFEGRGAYIKELMGYHNINGVTGDFALDVVHGFMFKDGEAIKPFRGSLLVGNVFSIIKDCALHEKDEHRGDFIGPAIAFNGRVVSK